MTGMKLKRNKIAIVVSPLIGCILVGIVGTVCLILTAFFDGIFLFSGEHYDLFERARNTNDSVLMGLIGTFSGMVLALFLFFLFYPFVLAVWAPLLGPLPHKGVSRLQVYAWRGSLVGALYCCLVASVMIHPWVTLMSDPGFMDDPAMASVRFDRLPLTLSASMTGAACGAAIGMIAGWLHWMILRPDQQLGADKLEAASVFD